MKAPRGLDRLYMRRIKDMRARRLLEDICGGVDGLRAVSALLKADRAIRFCTGRATKLDRRMRDIERRHAPPSTFSPSTTTKGD